MKKRKALSNILLLVVIILCLFAGLFFLCPYLINNTYERHEKAGKFLESDEKALKSIASFKVPDGYVTNYNLGNYYYNKGEYEKAVRYYKTALEWAPKDKKKDCNIRINLVLSYLKQMDFEEIEKSDDKTDAINKLKTYRNILTENGCANEKKDVFDGHSKDAEKLKKDIDDELEKLGDNSKNDDSDQNQQKESDDQSEQKDKESSTDQDLENKLNQQRSQNNQDRQQTQTEQRQQNSGQVPNAANSSNNSGDTSSDGTGHEGNESNSDSGHTKNW